tara:strand:- start:1471 stop:1983 length:513 start_codon:yes stop_codon:yes gene_type:complete
MSLKFEDMMQRFYDDPKLGIKKVEEDAPANSVAGGGVSLPPDAVMKKKKKNPYDGRTKEARSFFKRMSERKAKREAKSKLAQKVQENTVERASILAEDNLDILKNIVKKKQNQNIRFKDGSMKVDLFTASAITQVYDAVNRSNQQKLQKMLNGTKAQFMKMADFALSKVK